MNPLALLLDYRLSDQSVQIRTLGDLILLEIPLAAIETVHHGIQLLGVNVFFVNRLDLWHSAVTLRQKQGLLRNVVITPDQPEQFVATLRGLLRRRAG